MALWGVRNLDFTGHSSWEVKEPQNNLLNIWGAQTRPSSTTTAIQGRIVHLTRATDLQVTGRGFLRGAEHEAEDRFPVDTNTSGVPRVMHRAGLSTVRLRGGGPQDIKFSVSVPRL